MIIFLYGEDTYRSREKLREFKEKFRKEVDPSGNSLVFVDGESATMGTISEAVGAPSLFARKRMIIIERTFANKKKTVLNDLALYLTEREKKAKKDPSTSSGQQAEEDDSNILVFWDDISGEKMGANKLFKFLSKQPVAQNFKALSNTQAANWIRTHAKEHGVTIRQQAAMHLTSLFGSDLWQLCNEIKKLAHYKEGQDERLLDPNPSDVKAMEGKKEEAVTIEVDDVNKLTRGNYDENIFALTDAISNKNKSRALELFENEVDAGVTETYLMHMIVRQFRIMMQVRQALDLGQQSRKIASELKIHPFVVQKAVSQVRTFTLPVLKNIFSRLVEIDSKIKTGQADFKTAMGVLIARI